ncbi:hypothetical protein VCRA2120O389_260023 [Vibrio crassostreae]|nr:hypothetical protein VCRA2113O359_250023 [Vibrio crassostreae]CAK1955103.1 hypothetical protein VCRA2113O224_270037 [Vibrio crassostreae]CAK1956262.1 hypothetical protein VCRA2113O200_270023 [Vibrio crassostreae]CAK2901502.1 hypothetical protein VCRA2127O300_270023 [Vibrio crassostreae]CAK3330518.1 hypothetical protein VCRA2127O399_250023 [Vibrio crassostreae]
MTGGKTPTALGERQSKYRLSATAQGGVKPLADFLVMPVSTHQQRGTLGAQSSLSNALAFHQTVI